MTFPLVGSTAKALTLPEVGAPSDMCVGPIDSNRRANGTAPLPACDACDPAGRALIPDPARQPARTAAVIRNAQNQRRLNIVTSKDCSGCPLFAAGRWQPAADSDLAEAANDRRHGRFPSPDRWAFHAVVQNVRRMNQSDADDLQALRDAQQHAALAWQRFLSDISLQTLGHINPVPMVT